MAAIEDSDAKVARKKKRAQNPSAKDEKLKVNTRSLEDMRTKQW